MMLPDLPDEDRAPQIGPVKGLENFGEYVARGWLFDDVAFFYSYHLIWRHEGMKVEATGELLTVQYFANRALTREEWRDPEQRLRGEESTWENLNGLVRQAARGAAFLYAPTSVERMAARVVELARTWTTVPDDHPNQIERAMQRGMEEYEQSVERVRRLGGDPENPRNSSVGWYVPVEPLPGQKIGPSYRG